ncbi:hypothetical protein OG520_00950 [Streptomyces sp. NBC_00984]|nr:hypothetical protein OG520_00950 [Streptomyces sp. NBC_00984]
MVCGDPAGALTVDLSLVIGVNNPSHIPVDAQCGRLRGVLGDTGVTTDGKPQPPPVHFKHGRLAGHEADSLAAVQADLSMDHTRTMPIRGPGTGAPTRASDLVTAHAATIGASHSSSGKTSLASSSYPVSDISKNTTTRAPSARTAPAWVTSLDNTSCATHLGCATAMPNG